MNTFLAFLKKERMEQLRTGRFTILMIVFLLFGIMNPALAKLTPWMMEVLSGTLSDAGVVFTKTNVDALTSWTQFYKNISMVLLTFVLMTSSTFTAEYQKGTLVLVLTKGLKRIKVLAAKALTMLTLWTAGFALCYLVTYGYTAFFWDNGVAQHLFYAAFLYYLFGVWILSLMTLFSTLANNNTGVLLGTGGAVLVVYLFGLLPALKDFSPMALTDSLALLTGALAASATVRALAVTLVCIAVNCVIAALAFRKRSI